MLRGPLGHRRCGRGRAVGEPGAVGVGPAEGRQAGAAPEVLRVDATLLEGGVDERLQHPVRQQIGQDDLEVRSRGDGLSQRCRELAHVCEGLSEVFFACHQHITEGAQLFEDRIQARVVVDEPLNLGRERGDVAQQGVDGSSARVERDQQRLRVDQQPVDLFAAVTQDAGHLVGLGEQVFDLFVALTDGVGESGQTVECGTQMRVGLIDRLRQGVQRKLDGVDVPAGGGLGGVGERVVELIGRRALGQRQHAAGPQHPVAPRLDLEHLLPQDGVGLDRQPALGADRVAADGELDLDVIAVDRKCLHRTDVHPGDAHLVIGVQLSGVGELPVVAGSGEHHRDTGEALADGDDQRQHGDAHQPGAAAVELGQRSHCGVHLPVGCCQILTVRTGPPGCSPFHLIVRSHR